MKRRLPIWAIVAIPVALVIIIGVVLYFSGVFTPKTVVPNVVNMNFEKASQSVKGKNIKLFINGKIVDDSVAENTILTQSPEAGQSIRGEVIIAVEVSEKSYEVDIPDVTLFDKSLAKEKIESSGAKVDFKEEYSDTAPSGTVIGQSKKGKGSSADTVVLTVSKGPEDKNKEKAKPSSPAPEITGKTKEQAKKLLESAGYQFKITGEVYDDSVAAGLIISSKEKNNVVEATVSKGRKSDEKVVVPNVKYETQAEAKKQLEQRGLTVQIVLQANKDVPKGAVISQSVKSGTKVPVGTKVIITVSSGNTPPATTTAAKTTKKVTTTAKPFTLPQTTKKPSTTKPAPTSPDYDGEKKYYANFRLTTDCAEVSAGDEITVSLSLRTNYGIFAMEAPIIYDGDVFEIVNASAEDVSSYLSFEGKLAGTYATNGTWKSPQQMYTKRNSNPSYWSRSDIMSRWKIADASWAGNPSVCKTPVTLATEEDIVSFKLRVKAGVTNTEGRIFISNDFRKTVDFAGGILYCGRCADPEFSTNFVSVGQTFNLTNADVSVRIK